jgi:2-deoxy-scyllo-inosamine dehydrogenase (SAM-dependent)/8-amino-3,8-dideoxy-alpha-D-manno-octulosonate transaminase
MSTNQIPLFERLQIESQSNCNRACWFCPRTYDRSGNYLDANGSALVHQMPTETILDLLDQAQALGFAGRVGFHHYSEPLLDRRNIMLAREARRRGMKPYLHTNGDVLKRNAALCAEVREVYGLIVVGLYDYETNEQLEAEKQYWHERLAGANLQFSPIGLFGAQTAYSLGIPKALVPTDPRMATPDLTYANGPCHRPLIRMIIRHDGGMSNCCEDTFGAFDLGNIHESSLGELWYSARHRKVIADLVAGRRERYSLCRNCPLPPSGPPPDGQKMRIDRRQTIEPAAPAPS